MRNDITNLIEDIEELEIWNNFKNYNKVKYFFLYLLGFFSGIILISIFFLVM